MSSQSSQLRCSATTLAKAITIHLSGRSSVEGHGGTVAISNKKSSTDRNHQRGTTMKNLSQCKAKVLQFLVRIRSASLTSNSEAAVTLSGHSGARLSIMST